MSRAPVARVLVVSMAAALDAIAAMWPGAAGAESVRPASLLIYYGYPTSINATFSVPAAAVEFGRYDHVVWGDGLDDPAHPDHANAVAILGQPAMAATSVYGYVDLGVATQNLPMGEVQLRIARWRAMGVDGILLDDFGYDFGTGRERQNQAVDYAHGQGLAVIANAFRPEDAFGAAVDPVHNPSGAATHLGTLDVYLYESHGVRLGEYEDAAAWQERADALESYRASLDFRVFSVTTTATDDVGAYDESRFFYAWHAALLYGHGATGWGEFGFSATGASNGLAPFRTRPALDPGNAFIGGVIHAGAIHVRRTDLGRIRLDSAGHAFAFELPPVGVADPIAAIANPLAVAPNPMRADARIEFTLAAGQSARIVVYAPDGRRVCRVAAREFGPGRHAQRWAGHDDAGRRVAPGVYFAALEIADRTEMIRLVVLR